jgi:hypothetical protein
MAQAASAPPTPGGPNQPDDLNSALKLLRLLDPNEKPNSSIDYDVNSVIAYYDPARQLVTIIDGGNATDWCQDVRTLAHELVHAAQDRDLYYKTLTSGVQTFDDQQVVDTLVEGEAVLYQTLLDAKQHAHAHPRCRSAQQATRDLLRDSRDTVSQDPSPFRPATAQLAYPLGARYLGVAYESAGSLAVRRAFEARPDGDVRLMNEPHSPLDRPLPDWSCVASEAPQGYAASISESWGGFVAYAFATRVLMPEPVAWDNATTSAGDRFTVYADPAHDVIVDWSLRFRSPEDAQTLEEALRASALGTSIDSQLQGDVLQLRASSKPLDSIDMPWPSCTE